MGYKNIFLVNGLTDEKRLDKIKLSGKVRPENDTLLDPAIRRGFFMDKRGRFCRKARLVENEKAGMGGKRINATGSGLRKSPEMPGKARVDRMLGGWMSEAG